MRLVVNDSLVGPAAAVRSVHSLGLIHQVEQSHGKKQEQTCGNKAFTRRNESCGFCEI